MEPRKGIVGPGERVRHTQPPETVMVIARADHFAAARARCAVACLRNSAWAESTIAAGAGLLTSCCRVKDPCPSMSVACPSGHRGQWKR